MARRAYEYVETTCSRGINQQADLASMEECLDALNVWAPDGKVVTRPGYTGIITALTYTTLTQTILKARAEDVSAGTFSSPTGAGLLTLNSLEALASGTAADRWYLGHSSTFGVASITVSGTNSNATYFSADYYNGTAWVHLPVHELETFVTSNSPTKVAHLSTSPVAFSFVPPQDWATTTIDSQSAYWIRFSLRGANLDSAVEIDVDNSLTNIADGDGLRGGVVAQLGSQKLVVFAAMDTSSQAVKWLVATDVTHDAYAPPSTGITAPVISEPATFAILPQHNKVFAAYGETVAELSPSTARGDDVTALVESRDFAVGDGAAFDKTLIAQLGSFPAAKYISFFKGRLWSVEQGGLVRWGGPEPFHKVWPALSFEYLVENDNSEATGLRPLGEFQVVYKQDSVFIMEPTGENPATATQHFKPVKMVTGVGCVSNGSIADVNDEHIFLAEDGLYAFDGRGVRKITERQLSDGRIADRLKDFWPTVTPGRRPFAVGVNWSTRNTYLLAVSVDGSDANNRVVAWNYDNDAFWIWDNIEAQHWMLDEDSYDNQVLYFGDSSGQIYQFGLGNTDHGAAISSHFETQRFGYNRRDTRTLRSVELAATNKSRSATVTVRQNDDELNELDTTLDYTDAAEVDWDSITSTTWAWVRDRRRRRRVDVRKTAEWHTVKVAHSTKNQPLEAHYLRCGFVRHGAR